MTRPEPQPPVLIIGMHRSGTTLLARLLRDFGLHLGARRRYQEEASFFRNLNDLFLEQAGAAWDNPAPISHLLADEPVRALTLEYAHQALRSPQAVSFLGRRGFLRVRAIDALAIPWGWKDPRSTFTLPLWLDLFPEARAIHVVRHGVDVAQSLVERSARQVERARRRYLRRRWAYAFRPKQRPFVPTVRCSTLEGGFSLWEEYVDAASAHVAELGPRALEIRFEDLVADPQARLRELAGFAGLDPAASALEAAAAAIDTRRRYAYAADPGLQAFAESVAPRLEQRGYSAQRPRQS